MENREREREKLRLNMKSFFSSPFHISGCHGNAEPTWFLEQRAQPSARWNRKSSSLTRFASRFLTVTP